MSEMPKENGNFRGFVQEFMAKYRQCKTRFLDHTKLDYGFEQVHIDRLDHMIDYNCINGKLNRARCIFSIATGLCEFKNSANPADIVEKSLYLGVCNEVMHAAFLVADDISDKSEMRRGKPCWYRQPMGGSMAITDAFILESFSYFILKTFFANTAVIKDLLFLYTDTVLRTELGQMVDMCSQQVNSSVEDLEKRFNWTTYENIIINKTAFYTYYLPIKSALIILGETNESVMEYAKNFSLEIGQKFQIQDDFIDCFTPHARSGKVGIDIEENKCTWLVVKAMELATENQKRIILKHYGKYNSSDTGAIKDLYRELKLHELYLEEEEKSYRALRKMVSEGNKYIRKEILLPLIDQIHLRGK